MFLLENVDDLLKSVRLTVNRLYFRGVSISMRNAAKAKQETVEEVVKALIVNENSFNSFKPGWGDALATTVGIAVVPLCLNIAQVINII